VIGSLRRLQAGGGRWAAASATASDATFCGRHRGLVRGPPPWWARRPSEGPVEHWPPPREGDAKWRSGGGDSRIAACRTIGSAAGVTGKRVCGRGGAHADNGAGWRAATPRG